uniref:Ig-like domain-containing protein n=1 Tax=Pyxicephalus adspersus TaxID=30357 RepID=A0AAV2ZYL1_PYXAD|nr:TPA: hypothetical protein GDO54_017245 [Pyxicephalus adspersus]
MRDSVCTSPCQCAHLLVIKVGVVCAGPTQHTPTIMIHFMRYYSTAVSSPEPGLPEYSIVGYLDDIQIENYNSDTRQYLPKTEWMKKQGPEYWERETQISWNKEAVSKHSVQIAMSRFNQSGGFHIIQRMSGCELRDDGTSVRYFQYGYDGRDFLYLDTQSGIWIPTMNEAQLTAQKWNSPELRVGERLKSNLENQCMEQLKKFVEYGREELEKRVRPEVKVWRRPQSDEITRLYCLVYGFHPRAVDVKWMRNGVDHIPSDEMSPILPHPDGTYQIRVSVEVPKGEEDTFSCYVEHSSLEIETLTVQCCPSAESKTNMIITGAVVLVALIVGVVIAVITYRRRLVSGRNPGTNYSPAPNNEENSSNSSNG